ISALSGFASQTKGVDSLIESESVIDHAKQISNAFQTTVIMSGKTDVVVRNNEVDLCDRGSAMMPMIIGTGCLLSAVVAAFHAVYDDAFQAANAAVLFYAICGELAAKNAQGPGSFRLHFLDALHSSTTEKEFFYD